MAYNKTAKDLAWDKERIKLRSERDKWIRICEDKNRIIKDQEKQIKILKENYANLEKAFAELTKGNLSSEEAIEKMNKQAELADTLSFICNFSSMKGYM